MVIYGADVQQLKELSKFLANGASRLSGKARELDLLISQDQHWQGQDAKQFVAEWQGRLRPLIVKASQGIEEAAKKVLLNAEEQSSASTDGAGIVTMAEVGPWNTDPRVQPRLTPEEILERYQVKGVTEGEMTDWTPGGIAGLFTDERRKITEKEAEMLDGLYAWELDSFNDIHNNSFEEADARFESADKDDDHNDAFRHAYWNALMVKEFGAEWAEDYATAHEQLPVNQGPREAMDLYNNEVGRNIAIANPDASAEELADLVEKAVKDGETVVVGQDMLPHYSNEIPMDETGDVSKKVPEEPGHDPQFNN
jgi:hypothetical protein